jgi:hypothetical protein
MQFRNQRPLVMVRAWRSDSLMNEIELYLLIEEVPFNPDIAVDGYCNIWVKI